MNQKELVGGILMIAAVVVVIKLLRLIMNVFSGLFWVILLGVAVYAFLNPTFRNSLFSAFRYIYKRVFGE